MIKRLFIIALHQVLFEYSEWLDSQGLIVGEEDGDRRSHEELVSDFIAEDS